MRSAARYRLLAPKHGSNNKHGSLAACEYRPCRATAARYRLLAPKHGSNKHGSLAACEYRPCRANILRYIHAPCWFYS